MWLMMVQSYVKATCTELTEEDRDKENWKVRKKTTAKPPSFLTVLPPIHPILVWCCDYCIF